MKEIVFRPVGFMHTVFRVPDETKLNVVDRDAKVEILEEFQEGLKCLDGFSHIVLIFHFHLSNGFSLLVKPLKHNPKDMVCGVFATRSPFRPNPVGFSVVRLKAVSGNILHVENRDILDMTPILDIKPYLPEELEKVKTGWYVKN